MMAWRGSGVRNKNKLSKDYENMPEDLISKKTRNEFMEYFVNTTLREIEVEFDAAGVPFDSKYSPKLRGERRALVERYYNAVNWTKLSDVNKVLNVYQNVLIKLEKLSDDGADWAKKKFNSLKFWIEKDGFSYTKYTLIRTVENHSLSDISAQTIELGMPEIQRQIERMRSAVEDDPGLAIGTAKELVETTCKTILTELNISFKPDEDIGTLVKETRKVLNLVDDSIPDSAKGADKIRKLLSNLGTISQVLGELRNLYGTGHGKHGRNRGLSPRHARLAVGSAATLAIFLFETHAERTK